MSLRQTGESRRARGVAGGKKGQNKMDTVLELLNDDDREAVLEWLHAPDQWSNYMIAESLSSFSREQNDGNDYAVSHPTIKTWRQRQGVIS